jgi:hypothetical protein
VRRAGAARTRSVCAARKYSFRSNCALASAYTSSTGSGAPRPGASAAAPAVCGARRSVRRRAAQGFGTTHRLQRDGVLGGPLGGVQQAAVLQVVNSLPQLLQLLRG